MKVARTLGLVTWTLEVPGLAAEPYRDTRGPGLAGVRQLLRRVARRHDAKGWRDHTILRLLPNGATDHIVRTVTENSRTLKFTSHGFEAE